MKKINTSTLIAFATIAALTVALQACTDGNGKGKTIPRASEPIPVRVVTLEKTAGHSTIKASGQLTTDDETLLSFKTGGVIKSVLVKEGDAVRKGQLLATLDLGEINALVAQARLGFEKAERDLQRMNNLFRDSVATLEQLQNTQTALAVAKEQLEAASFNKNFSEIHAAANGFVLKKFVNAGQVVGVGDPVVQTNGGSQGKWILKTGVSDKQWAQIRVNDKATVMIDAFPGKTFSAAVIRKGEKADQATGSFTVELEVQRQDVKFAAGMFGAMEVQTGASTQSWNVPYEAVLDASGNEGFVFVTRDNRTAEKQPVTIESFDGKFIHISKGLEEGSALIISGSAYLTDHSPIIILK